MIILLFFSILFSQANAKDVSLKEFMQIAWQKHPLFNVQSIQADEREELADSAKANYMPHLSLQAVDTTGFAGSTSTLRLGGLVGSAYRKGAAAGIVWDQLIYDFGRTSALLQKYQATSEIERVQTEKEKYIFISRMAALYLNCAKSQELKIRYQSLLKSANLIYDETTRMTNTGQKSIIDHALTQNDLTELKRELENESLVSEQISAEMAIYAADEKISCLSFREQPKSFSLDEFKVESPRILLAKALLANYEAQAQELKANQRPVLSAVGSYGTMEDSRVVTKQDYSAGIGIVFPFFNGGEDAHKEKVFKLKSLAQKEEIKIAQMEFDIHQRNLSQNIAQLKRNLRNIESQYSEIDKATNLAIKRYASMQGSLVDVRESFKRLKAIEIERLKMNVELASFILEKEIIK